MQSIYTYINFRLFLDEQFEAKKAKNSHVSHRMIALKTDTSVGFFSKVVKGKSKLSVDKALKFAEFFSLSQAETEFFLLLIQYDQAGNLEQRKQFLKEILQIQAQHSRILGEEFREFYSTWKYSLIRESLALLNDDGNPQVLKDRFCFILEDEEIDSLIQKMVDWDMLEPTEQGYARKERKIQSGEGLSKELKQLNSEMMDLAKDAMYNMPFHQRGIYGLTLSLSSDSYHEFLDATNEYRRKIVALAQNSRAVDRVLQVNLQHFPLVKAPEVEE